MADLLKMDDLDIQILFDDLGEVLLNRGMHPDDIEEYLVCESQRVAQELRDAGVNNA